MIGRTLSHFKITAKLGEGGMGEVYRAEDTRLGREVAIKVLPEALTADPDRLARFEREARVLASLNHPNIAGIHQIEEAGGQQLLVMELVEGQDLSAVMARGPIEIEEAAKIVRQVLLGLEAAHERGIVHRDLKPANLMVTASGEVKILDFGLAKAHEASTSNPDMTSSPTLTVRLTQIGVILGTAAYMSPEQARGQEADPRADLWALGVVFFEMLSGGRMFAEPTVSDTLAAVLRADFDWQALPERTPRRLKRVLQRCLERDPKQRYHAAADVRIDLDEALTEEESAPLAAEAPSPSSRLPWLVAAAAVAAALVLAFMNLGRAAEPAASVHPRVTASLLPPETVDFTVGDFGLALSSDGTRLAFGARDTNGTESIWIRSLTRGTEFQVDSTEGARGPFWSPDGGSLGFTQDGQLKVISLDSGVVDPLAPQAYSVGGTWGAAGDIVYADDDDLALRTVKLAGGSSREVTERPEDGGFYFGPDFLPDGEHFIFFYRRYGSEDQIGQIRLGSLDGTPSTFLRDAYSVAQFVEPGFIVWWHQGNLRAQRFDSGSLQLIGEPFAIASEVRFDPRSGFATAALSDSGALVFQPGGTVAGDQLVWYNRQGEVLGTLGDPGSLYGPRLSPDGTRVALDISGDSNAGDIWVLDADRGFGRRITTWPEDESVSQWSPDGEALVFFSLRGGGAKEIFLSRLTGAAEPELVFAEPGVHLSPHAWLPDGTALLLRAELGKAKNLWALTFESGEARAVIESGFNVENAHPSPDGEWVAYDSDETGRSEIYLASFPDAAQRVRVSTDGGFGPVWSPDGTEIFFASNEADSILAASVSMTDEQPAVGRPAVLFHADIKEHSLRQFDTHDGQRFLVNTRVNTGTRTPLTLVLNWAEGL